LFFIINTLVNPANVSRLLSINKFKCLNIYGFFINALFQKNEEIIHRLLKTPEGKKKIIEIYPIKNVDGYPSLQE